MLYTLIYRSDAIMNFGRYELNNLLGQARTHNACNEITGILLYSEKKFLQVLEGENNSIESLYKNIQNDSRHFNITTIIKQKIDKRIFPNWTMGYKNIDPMEYRNIPGLSLFFDDGLQSKIFESLIQFRKDPTCFDKNFNA